MTAQLYCFGESGNAYKAALTMALAGFAWEPVFVDFFNGGARSPEYRALNPMGEVPVLVDGATVLSQSGAIVDYVLERTGAFEESWDRAARREVLRWVLWDNHKFSSVAGSTRFLMNFLDAEHRPAEVISWHQGRLRASLKVLDGALAGRDWLAGDAISSADIACCSYLYYPEPFGFDRADWPHIDAWLTRIAAQPGWKHPYDLMPGNPGDRVGKEPR
ncbi:MAG: glutathione S-transferase family protein [Rhodobacteraceae bacterium]|jgi:glutathione S-transferase|nr:glutathione S-transferase family protein [Paracoccaceae bacterium]